MYITLQSVWISVDIPQLLLMTKVEEACPLVKENLSNVYRSEYIYKKVLLDSFVHLFNEVDSNDSMNDRTTAGQFV